MNAAASTGAASGGASDPSPAERARPHVVRASALMALYQIDQTRASAARAEAEGAASTTPGDDDALARAILEQDELGEIAPTDAEAAAGVALARSAWARRDDADAALEPLSPEWPVRRQPMIDRNLLRLAWHEITSKRVKAAIAIDEAVELARTFGSERSPAFVNGVLGALVRGETPARGDDASAPPAADGTHDDD